MDKEIMQSYESCFSALNGDRSYQFRPTENQKKQIKNFILNLDKQIGLSSVDGEFIFYFIAYQFYLKKDQKSRFGRRIPLNHVVGNRAMDKWLRKPENWKYWVDKMINSFNIPKTTSEEIKEKEESLNKSEERIKERYLGSDDLFFHCSEYTSLFNPLSNYCKDCPFIKSCKSLQKQLYPKIYESRNEGL